MKNKNNTEIIFRLRWLSDLSLEELVDRTVELLMEEKNYNIDSAFKYLYKFKKITAMDFKNKDEIVIVISKDCFLPMLHLNEKYENIYLVYNKDNEKSLILVNFQDIEKTISITKNRYFISWDVKIEDSNSPVFPGRARVRVKNMDDCHFYKNGNEIFKKLKNKDLKKLTLKIIEEIYSEFYNHKKKQTLIDGCSLLTLHLNYSDTKDKIVIIANENYTRNNNCVAMFEIDKEEYFFRNFNNIKRIANTGKAASMESFTSPEYPLAMFYSIKEIYSSLDEKHFKIKTVKNPMYIAIVNNQK